MIAIKKDSQLWQKLKKQIQGDKKWNARMGQQLSKLYKKEGGEYLSPKSKTSLNKWTREKWDYVTPESKRYLPEKVIKNLTEKEKKDASKGKKLGEKKKYPESLLKKMKKLGILKK